MIIFLGVLKMSKNSFERTIDSYEKVKITYETFKQMKKKLGIPKRTIFNSEVISGDIEGRDFLETVEMLKKKEKT